MHSLTVPPAIGGSSPSGEIWSKTVAWIGLCDAYYAKNSSAVDAKLGPGVYPSLKITWSAISQLLTSPPATPSERYARRVVFCHMDLQSLNALRYKPSSGKEVKLIDFEYSCHNPR